MNTIKKSYKQILIITTILSLCMILKNIHFKTEKQPEPTIHDPILCISVDTLYFKLPELPKQTPEPIVEPDSTYNVMFEEFPIQKANKKKKKAPSNRWGISLSSDERDLLAKIVWLEARGEGQIGQEAVIEIIFNRMVDNDYFHGTLYEVLSEDRPCQQFTTWKNRNNAEPTDDIYESIDEVLNGNTNIFTFDYLYFSRGGHKKHKDCIQIGNHQFCTEG